MSEFLSERANPSHFLERRPGVDKVNANHLLEKLPHRTSAVTNTYAKSNPTVFLDLAQEAEKAGQPPEPLGRVSIQLLYEICPKTCENFRCLCTGERTNANGKQLTYSGSLMHRVIPGFIVQGGDITKRNGTGGESIYGEKFADESFLVKHSAAGLVSMANAGPNTNNSQFFITLAAAPHLDKKNVVFGKVTAGLEIVKRLGEVKTDRDDCPVRRITITGCGQLQKPGGAPIVVPSSTEPKAKSTVEEESEKERRRRSEAEGELQWFHDCAKVMEQGYKERLDAMEPAERKVLELQRKRQRVATVGSRADQNDEEEEKRQKEEKGIVAKRRRMFF